MKIGELAERTGIPPRMLRYFEQQGLLESERSANVYRAFGDDEVARAKQVRALIQSGLSTRMAKVVLDLERQCELAAPPSCTRALAEELAEELSALEARLSCLTKSRDALALYLERTENGDLLRREVTA